MIYLRRPIHILNPRDEGYVIPDSFVVFGRKPWMTQGRILSPEERVKKGYAIENEIVQWRYRLRVDLWLVVFDFVWNGRKREL